MGKNNNNTAPKTFAEEGLEEIQDTANEAEANVSTTTPNEGVEEVFQQVGGLEPVAYFLRTSAPKKPTSSPYKVIAKGDTIIGRYERSFVGGKFDNRTYLVRLETTGELIGLPGAGSLSKSMDKLAEGSKVKITYEGMQAIKNGKWEGTDAHLFTVFGSKLK